MVRRFIAMVKLKSETYKGHKLRFEKKNGVVEVYVDGGGRYYTHKTKEKAFENVKKMLDKRGAPKKYKGNVDYAAARPPRRYGIWGGPER